MAGSATNSAIEVAYWFISRAEDEGLFLEDEKLHHLLFLAQVHFALANNMELLMPSLFVCSENGFSEPNLHIVTETVCTLADRVRNGDAEPSAHGQSACLTHPRAALSAW